jgi:Asp-tRNA(Asn)/Glu-tRNA(Gln) amidotransferase C subunit
MSHPRDPKDSPRDDHGRYLFPPFDFGHDPRASIPPNPDDVPHSKQDFASGCFRAQVEHQTELNLLETLPLGEDTDDDNPLCQLLERSAKNQQKILQQIEKLAAVLGKSADCVTGCWEATTVAQKTETLRSDLDAKFEFLQTLKGSLNTKIEGFFQIPDVK